MTLVLFNIGWMKNYKGQTEEDKIVNGGQYVKVNKRGNEVRNFLPIENFQYGYVRPPGKNHNINLERLGADPSADYVDDVTVVFVAKRPQGSSVVIGWYDNARVWRSPQKHEDRVYYAKASKSECTILKVDERMFRVPRANDPKEKWGMGQSNVRYIDEKDEEAKNFIQKLHQYLESSEARPPKPNGGPRQVDQARKVMVEKAAIDHVIKYYCDKKGFKGNSVEQENKGWDLEFTCEAFRLLVEVKGCSGGAATVELTPNEYKAMKRQSDEYRLAIVTNALKQPRLKIISFNGSDQTWRDQEDREICIEVLEGARIKCN